MNDDELRSLLDAWKAPPAPPSLRARVFRRRARLLQWLFAGSIRIPVPVAVACIGLLIFNAYREVRPPEASLSQFEQVRQLQPRIVRTAYETP